jgi:hypothetical protein
VIIFRIFLALIIGFSVLKKGKPHDASGAAGLFKFEELGKYVFRLFPKTSLKIFGFDGEILAPYFLIFFIHAV